MSEWERCDICNKPINWDDLIWNISSVKGYKTKVFKCCEREKAKAIPVSKEEIEFWDKIL